MSPLKHAVFCFPWGVENTPLANKKGPRAWQKKIMLKIEEKLRHKKKYDLTDVLKEAICSGRGVGKSALIGMLTHWFFSTRVGGKTIMSANSEAQLKSTTWAEFQKWTAMSVNKHWFEVGATKAVPAKWLSELVRNQLQKSTDLWAVEQKLWDADKPSGYAGEHNDDGLLLIYDEASGIPNSIWNVSTGFFTEKTQNKIWLAISNGRNDTGYFYEIFCENSIEGQDWGKTNVNALDVEEVDHAELLKIIAKHGEDSDMARIEVFGMFPKESSSLLISPKKVDAAMAREEVLEIPRAIRILGIDPSGPGKDAVALEGRCGYEEIFKKRMHSNNYNRIMSFIMDGVGAMDWDVVVIDEGGLGWAIANALRKMGVKCFGVNFKWKASNEARWKNKRAEMYDLFHEWLEFGKLIPDQGMKSELGMITIKESSPLLLNPKNKMPVSPDRADAFALTFCVKDAKIEKMRKSSSPTRLTSLSQGTDHRWML